jgi:hypothetical protein
MVLENALAIEMGVRHLQKNPPRPQAGRGHRDEGGGGTLQLFGFTAYA